MCETIVKVQQSLFIFEKLFCQEENSFFSGTVHLYHNSQNGCSDFTMGQDTPVFRLKTVDNVDKEVHNSYFQGIFGCSMMWITDFALLAHMFADSWREEKSSRIFVHFDLEMGLEGIWSRNAQ